MGYKPRIETDNLVSFQTIRTTNSELWFINNHKLEQYILGYLAKYKTYHGMKLYAFALEGSHSHYQAVFPKSNRADFARDFHSRMACAVPEFVPEFGEPRKVWGRRYSCEIFPSAEDTEKGFFYSVLQPVADGLVDRISDYPGYNCFHDAIHGIARKYKVFNKAKYNDAKRYRKQIRVKDFIEEFTLEYERLPGYEHLTQKEYAALMQKKLEEHRQEILKLRQNKGLGFAGKEALLKKIPGTRALNPKTSSRHDFRPLSITSSKKRADTVTKWWFDKLDAHKVASKKFREGDLTVEFPKGMYRPPSFTIKLRACLEYSA